MKSITKRRLKTRSIGRHTLHKRRHSNRRWNTKQNKSRKKRMIGGAVGYKGGGGLTRLFKNSGWKCKCITRDDPSTAKFIRDTPNDNPPTQSDSSDTPRPPHPESSSSYRRQSRQRPKQSGDSNIVASSNDYDEFLTTAVTAPDSSPSSGFRRRVAQSDIKDATKSRNYLVDTDFELVGIGGDPTIIIRTKRGADDLPEHINNKNFITKVNNIDIKVNTLAEFYKLLNDNNFYDNPVVLTVARGAAGGTGPEQFMVRVILKRDIPRQGNVGGGGKKTTYQRKKHVTRRKINTKRRNVMVGGTTIKEVTCTCTKEEKAPRRNKISPTPPSAEESNV